MAFRMSEQSRTIKIYNLLAGTNEFIGEGDAYIPPHTGLPANSTDIAPPDTPAGFVAVFNSEKESWHLVEDHRGKTVYNVESGSALFISELGPLPENVTWLSPEGGISEVERHCLGERCRSRKTVSDTGSGRNKK